MQQVALEKIKSILRQTPDLKPKISVEQISATTRFREDLGFDSLAMASFFYELQESYPALDEQQVGQWKSLADCMNAVVSVQ